MSKLQLIKMIPARKEIIKFNWCHEFMKMSPKYREIRAATGSPMDTCFWCSHRFVDGEMIMLAQSVKGRNKVLCKVCSLNMTKVPT